MTEKEKIIRAQREIIQGYYNRICSRKCTVEEIAQWLEDDLQEIRMNNLIVDAEAEINKPQKDPHCVGQLVCDMCSYDWTAVYPEGTKQYECPKCNHMNDFKKPE